jgi:hypothetical protein
VKFVSKISATFISEGHTDTEADKKPPSVGGFSSYHQCFEGGIYECFARAQDAIVEIVLSAVVARGHERVADVMKTPTTKEGAASFKLNPRSQTRHLVRLLVDPCQSQTGPHPW